MDPTALMPVPDAIPVGWGWFEGLNILTFVAHIIMVNILLGGGLLAAWLALADRHDPLARAVANKLPTTFALAVNFGVAPLLFLQVLYGHLFYTSAVLSAVWWLSVIVLLIAGYYALYIHQHRQKAEHPGSPVFLVFGLGMVLCISLVLTSVLATMETPFNWTEYFTNPQGTILTFFKATTVPRYLHFLLASVALGGLFAALVADRPGQLPLWAAEQGRALGMKVFTSATLVQMAVGLWWLMALPRGILLQFMGGDLLASGLLLAGVASTIPLLLAGFAGRPRSATLWVVVTVSLMVVARAVLRNLSLAPYFSPRHLTVTGEVSPLVLFLVSLGLGLIAVGYMLRLAVGPSREG
ncbi:hypothetical protein DND132_0857 [Pseudodesulfovibrio mercurii]|uniref:Uncharacterized protein n=1 Tax=Pseudodesulfovibrio mercurii TaxID=641491 RepID=F0JHL2_9BACT|nr:hypothetical protein [Pseudodesulfovibrio mercurii]EGB14072.1 hypothetical protein DND132_0857 [Pseudodesulfovibrio mercurii]